MKVKALHNVKIGNNWYKAGDVFETNLSCIVGDSVEIVEEPAVDVPEPEPAAEAISEPATEPAREPAKRGRKKA